MKKILICEDEAEVQRLLNDLIAKKGYKVDISKDGKEAINMAKEIDPDLILLDIRMPKIDGLEVAREIRKFNTHSKIIFLTAFQSPELIKEAVKYDITSYLVKNISPKNILQVVERALK